MFDILDEFFPTSSWFNATDALKHLSSWLIGFIVAFSFFIQSGESIYDPPWVRLNLWHCNKTS